MPSRAAFWSRAHAGMRCHIPRSCADAARKVCRSGIVAPNSGTTIWRWLHEDAIRPWQHRCWFLPRNPHFDAKVGRALDLHARRWQGRPFEPGEFVLSTNEKTNAVAPGPISPPWTYIAASSSTAA